MAFPKEYQKNNQNNSEKSAEELNSLGIQALNKSNFIYAEQCLEEAIKKDPSNPEYYHNAACIAFNLQGYDRALHLVGKALELKKIAGWFRTKSGVLFKMGKYDDALKVADEGLRLEPNHAGLLDVKSVILYKMGKYDDALKVADEGLRLEPNHENLLKMQSMSLAGNYRYDEALNILDRAIQLYPNNEEFQDTKYSIIQTRNEVIGELQKRGYSFEQFIRYREIISDGVLRRSDIENNFFRFSWKNAEVLVGKLFEAKGYSINVTGRTGDFGIDVEAMGSDLFLGIQVKHWNADVGFEDIAKTLGVSSKFDKVIIVSTKSGFTKQAREFASRSENRIRLELWDSFKFKRELEQFLLS